MYVHRYSQINDVRKKKKRKKKMKRAPHRQFHQD